MRVQYLVAALVMAPLPAMAENTSIVIQQGMNNVQVTRQAGDNFAVTVQVGDNNVASTTQNGNMKFSAIGQFGEGQTKVHTQLSGPGAQSSVQVSTDLPNSSASKSVTNTWFTLTTTYEAN